MNKKILKFSFVFLVIFVFGSFFATTVFAQDGIPIVTYKINGNPESITVNPISNPIQLEFISDENIENWVSIRIENDDDPSVYKIFLPKSQCDNTLGCIVEWNGDISPSEKTLIDGIYSVIVKIKNITEPTFELTLTSPFTIQVDTSTPDPEPEPEEDPPLLIEEEIALKNGCEVEDTDGETYIFPQDDSPSEYLAICVLQEALDQGFINGFELINNPDFGLYVHSVNGIEPDGTEFWALWLNGGFANCGIGCLSILEGNILSLILTDWMTETESATILLHIVSLVPSTEEENEEEIPPPQSGGGGGGGGTIPLVSLNITNALNYLKSVQATDDGSFGGALLYTDWAAIAFGAGNVTGSPREKLLVYLASQNSTSPLLTDNERRAMALMALGENPYDFNGVNYIEAILDTFDGTQFGDINLINDDIFALIPLASAGYTTSDEIITKSVAFIISKQNPDGSWENSVDITAAAIQALKSFESVTGATNAMTQGTTYLQNAQGNDGGWNNVFSTSWAMQAMSALSASWTKNSLTGADFLAGAQATDGAISPIDETLPNRIWATSYAIPAALGKPWSAIMQSFPKPSSVSFNLSSANPQVVITSQNQTVDIIVANDTADGNINISSLISAGTGSIPKMNITSSQNILVNIPATNITSADPNWDGILALPKTTTITLPETDRELKTVSVAIEVGSDNQLSFSNAVRILFLGEVGKKIGFSRTGTNFTEITSTCSGDSQTANDTLAVDGDCKIDVGSDLAVWTKHFTTFATYTTVSVAGNTGGGGGGGTRLLLTSQNNASDSTDTLAENNISLTESDSAVANTPAVEKKSTSVALANKSKSIAPELPKDASLEITSDMLTASVVDALPQEKTGKTIPVVPITIGVLSGIILLFFLRKFLII